ncbi:MAG: ABC transporter ATP-binding protein [Rhabdochlamydiaceae bacterium]|nr:ABC transporter ATP-binding protein [Candidatus Amphrikana amoebophyrae]
MKLLLKAAIRAKDHIMWLIFMLISLVILTLASQAEMLSLGVMTSSGADFFTLFQEKKEDGSTDKLSRHQVEVKWDDISKGKADITREDAAKYLSKNDTNPLGRLLQKIKSKVKIERGRIHILVLVIIAVALFKASFLFISRYTTQVLSIKISQRLRQDYFEHIQSLPMSFYQEYNIGSLSSRVAGDATQIARSLNACVTNYVVTPFTAITSLVACFYFSWQLSLVVFVALPLIILPIIMITKKVRSITRQLQKNQENFSSVLIDFLSGIQTVKIFAMELFSLKKYKEQNDQMAHLEQKTAKYDLMVRPILHTITTFCLAAVLIFGLYILKLTIAELIVFCGFLNLFYEPVKKFADENTVVQKGIVAAERLYEVLNIKPQIEDDRDAIPLTEFKEKIEFDRVWFSYEEKWILKDVSFTVNKGETVAIVGPTGSGKSTILQLLPRLYEVQKGEIRIDGENIDTYTKESLRNNISFVPQKPFLFYDTVKENIAYGQKFPMERIIDAAKKAHAHDFIHELPHTYDTHLAETGKNLSGGQQQRLAVARALAKQAPILILDEATSSLDSLSEDKIKSAIVGLHHSVTQIIVAHRLTTIEHADRILFIEEGVKIAEGTKDELLKTCPEFKLLWDMHFKTSKVKDKGKIKPEKVLT